MLELHLVVWKVQDRLAYGHFEAISDLRPATVKETTGEGSIVACNIQEGWGKTTNKAVIHFMMNKVNKIIIVQIT